MKKDTTKKFLTKVMKIDRFAKGMMFQDIVIGGFIYNKINGNLIDAPQNYDLIEFSNVFSVHQKASLNTNNQFLFPGYKEQNIVFDNNKQIEFNMIYCEFSKNDDQKTASDGFFIGETNITQEFYELIMGNNPSDDKNSKYPVELVSWYDAVSFCNELSQKQGLETCYEVIEVNQDALGRIVSVNIFCDLNKNGYRLPIEREWECAARANTNNKYPGCNDESKILDYGWLANNSNYQMQVIATKKPNEWGIYDMLGGVAEWVNDEIGIHKILKSISCFQKIEGDFTPILITSHWTQDPNIGMRGVGFRIARSSNKHKSTFF